jgi:hypothetical protein
MGCLSLLVARGRPSPATLHPRPAAPRPLPRAVSGSDIIGA